MKKFFFLAMLFLIIPFSLKAQVKWLSLEEATQLQKAEPKKIFLFFYNSSRNVATSMEQHTFGNPIIQSLINEQYYPVKFDVLSQQPVTWNDRTFHSSQEAAHIKSDFHQFAQFMNVNATPSSIFLDNEGMPITIIQGALSASELEPYLQFMTTHDSRVESSAAEWQAFLKKFNPKVKLKNR